MDEILAGLTDYSELIFIADPASTDGSGKTGLVAANLTVSYSRMEIDNDATVTDVTSSLNNLAALTTAHTDWGLIEISSTLAPGLYRLDLADAVIASGAWKAVVYVMITSSAAAATPKQYKIVDYDPYAVGTRLPAVAAITNLNTVFNTDFGTNYDATNDRWTVNVKTVNDVSTSPVTTIKAVQGLAVDGVITTLTNLPAITANWLTAAGTAADFSTELRTAINGGDWALSTDSNGRIRLVDGTGTGEVDTSSGSVSVFDFTTAAKALLQTEAEDALVTHRLDELLNADSDIDGAAPPTVGSVIHEMLTKTTGSFTYDQTTDSQEAIRDYTAAEITLQSGVSSLGSDLIDIQSYFTGITRLSHWLGMIAGKQTANATALTEIRASGAGSGTYDPTTDALEALQAEHDTTQTTLAALNNITAASVWAVGTRTLSALGFTLAASDLATDTITAAKVAADVWTEGRTAINGGDWALSTNSSGMIRIADGTATGEIDTASGAVTVGTNNDKTGYALSSAGIAGIWDLTDGIETSVTPRQAFRGLAAILLGINTGAGTGTEVFKGIGQSSGGTTRATATVDSSGNRSAWVLNL